MVWFCDNDAEDCGIILEEGQGGIISAYECPKCPTECEVLHFITAYKA